MTTYERLYWAGYALDFLYKTGNYFQIKNAERHVLMLETQLSWEDLLWELDPVY